MNYNKFMKGGVAAVMAMSLVACSSGDTSDSGNTGAAGTAFKIGASGPLTGDNAVYGLAVQNGAEIAVEEINAKGGVQLEFMIEDDQADGEQSVTAFNNLMDNGMQISLGTVTSGAGQTVSPLYADEEMFVLTPSGSSTAIIYRDTKNEADPYGNVFQMCFTDPNQGVASADYIAEHEDLGTKVGVIYRNDDNYSNGLYTKFMEEAETLGLEVVAEEAFQDGTTDFSVYVQKCQEAGADIVFLPIYYQPASQILTEADRQGYDATFFGCDGMDGILTLEGFDTSLAEGLYMLTPFSADATDDLTTSFVEKYQEKCNGEIPNQFAADAYDAVYAIAQALEAADVTAEDDVVTIKDALVEQFTSMTFNGLTGTDVTWNENGEVSKAPKAVVIQDGAYVGVE